MPVHATDKPCGAECYKLQPAAVAAPLGHPQMPAAPLERTDSMPKRRGKGRWRAGKRACLPSGAAAANGGCVWGLNSAQHQGLWYAQGGAAPVHPSLM